MSIETKETKAKPNMCHNLVARSSIVKPKFHGRKFPRNFLV